MTTTIIPAEPGRYLCTQISFFKSEWHEGTQTERARANCHWPSIVIAWEVDDKGSVSPVTMYGTHRGDSRHGIGVGIVDTTTGKVVHNDLSDSITSWEIETAMKALISRNAPNTHINVYYEGEQTEEFKDAARYS